MIQLYAHAGFVSTGTEIGILREDAFADVQVFTGGSAQKAITPLSIKMSDPLSM